MAVTDNKKFPKEAYLGSVCGSTGQLACHDIGSSRQASEGLQALAERDVDLLLHMSGCHAQLGKLTGVIPGRKAVGRPCSL